MGRLDEALEALGQARDILSSLEAEDPSKLPSNLTWSLQGIGEVLLVKGDSAGALRTFSDELAIAEAWAGRNPDNPRGRRRIARAHRDMGKALLAAGRPSEALDHLHKAEAIDGAPAKDQPHGPLSPAGLADDLWRIGLALRDLGDNDASATAARRAIGLFEGLPSPKSSDLYAFACARAALSGLAGRAGSGVSPVEGRAEADKAMALLLRVVADGEGYPGRIRTEHAFRPLHTRPDFQLLLMDRSMPADPFAPGA
jgi:tetratricopeptide (TPR) repeat protein